MARQPTWCHLENTGDDVDAAPHAPPRLGCALGDVQIRLVWKKSQGGFPLALTRRQHPLELEIWSMISMDLLPGTLPAVVRKVWSGPPSNGALHGGMQGVWVPGR
jgi:hypothetical protein